MIFFCHHKEQVYAFEVVHELSSSDIQKLSKIFDVEPFDLTPGPIQGEYIGPKRSMVSPWCTNVLSILRTLDIHSVTRVEVFRPVDHHFDPMLEEKYTVLDQDIFYVEVIPKELFSYVENIAEFSEKHGLALSEEDVQYLKKVAQQIERPLTNVEVFGYAQINSEHCRHKIFNGTFILDKKKQLFSLFELIKKTTKTHPNVVVSAYTDNVAFLEGPRIQLFRPQLADRPSSYIVEEREVVISLKAETHNFPTTVEPFYGASTGTGGEIRDRMAGGRGSIPLAGTAVYMTSLPSWHKRVPLKYPYHLPEDILIKASNGASDFANKFGQPLVTGSVYVFSHEENDKRIAYDKVVMLAGGVGYALKSKSKKSFIEAGQPVVMLGGDNYRIGIGGGSVSSVETGKYDMAVELSAVQRANPEMQKKVYNVIRHIAENNEDESIVSIHDHGAGGHLNCFVELLEQKGGVIEIDKLPKGDPTLDDVELLVNESQERMGLVVNEKSKDFIVRVAQREKAPLYVVGKVNNSHKISFVHENGKKPFDLKIKYLLENPPRLVIEDFTIEEPYREPSYSLNQLEKYLDAVLQHEAVGCKDWLTNKVDRSVTGLVATQPTTGPLQLPLNNVGVVALDYLSYSGIATAIGHASIAGLISSEAGARLSVTEALSNLVWSYLRHGLKGVSLSVNWMWPARNPGEDVRLYKAVKAISDFCIDVGINIPTGKDSLSMTQKYKDNTLVKAPGTVVVSAVAEVADIRKTVTPTLVPEINSNLLYIDFSGGPFALGGSVFYQTLNAIGMTCPDVPDPNYVKNVFDVMQELIASEKILAGHDVSAGGLITTLLEMVFAQNEYGLELHFSEFPEKDLIALLFSEKPALIIQVKDAKKVVNYLRAKKVVFYPIGHIIPEFKIKITHEGETFYLDAGEWRRKWYYPSFRLEQKQTSSELAAFRYHNFDKQLLKYEFPLDFRGTMPDFQVIDKKRPRVAVIREEGTNGDREMAYSLYAAGMEVVDVHMTDLFEGRADLKDVRMVVFPGGFSYADVLGSATGWAAGFLYNERARKALEDFFSREDTLSLGVCNGCQLMVKLGLFERWDRVKVKMMPNDSKKFESGFVLVNVEKSSSIMLKPLAGAKLGIWVAHGEGKFVFETPREKLHIPLTYVYEAYPGNPNGSEYNAAAICSSDGRHLAMMPHLERSIFPWQWPYYPREAKHEISPWYLAFLEARKWLEQN